MRGTGVENGFVYRRLVFRDWKEGRLHVIVTRASPSLRDIRTSTPTRRPGRSRGRPTARIDRFVLQRRFCIFLYLVQQLVKFAIKLEHTWRR